VASDYANRPVNYVSYWDSCRFANWLNNGQPTGAQGAGTTETGTYTLGGYNGADGRTIGRNVGAKWAVTSEDEWYKAAYYKSGSTNAGYWDFPTSSDTTPGRDMTELTNPGNNANYQGTPYPIDSPHYTTLVGEFEKSASSYNTFDQGGNVWEWNEAVTYTTDQSVFRGIRGGSFFSDDSHYLLASNRDDGHAPTNEYLNVGFRVASIPEPGSVTLSLAGAVAFLIWRFRGGRAR